MSKEENSDGTERQKDVSFHLIEVKKNHFDQKDLMEISMVVDEKVYEMSFLLDDYDVKFFPEFKTLDKYEGVGGFKVIHKFLNSIRSKLKYYSETHMNKESKKSNFRTYEKEWWMSENKGELKETTNEFNSWVRKNSDYLTQHDISDFDNKMIKEVVDYLEIREEFVQPDFISLEKETDVFSLEDMLSNAIKIENYEEAAKLREKIKTLKKTQ